MYRLAVVQFTNVELSVHGVRFALSVNDDAKIACRGIYVFPPLHMPGATQHVFETLLRASPRDQTRWFLQILVTNTARVLTAFRDSALQRLQHKHEEAVPLLERALAIRMSALGEGHNDTTLSQINLEMAQREVGDDRHSNK